MKKQDSDCSSSHGSDSGSSDDNDDDLDDDEKELVPYRPELENITSQKILMFVPPPNSPPHPKTVYFLNDPDLNENIPNKKIKTEEVTINEKKYMFLYKAYKNLPLCLSGPMKFNGVIRSKLFDNTNIIWKLMKQDRMFPFLQELNQYQRFNHFPMTWQLSRKDNLYNNYFKLHTKFPKDYHYMPETYCLPKDYDLATRREIEIALLAKGQKSKRYKLGEIWELNYDEIREALDELIPSYTKNSITENKVIDDMISRRKAISKAKELYAMGDCYCDEYSMVGMLNSLPPAQPEREKSEWIEEDYVTKIKIRCKKCGEYARGVYRSKFCPNCGRDMWGKNNGKTT